MEGFSSVQAYIYTLHTHVLLAGTGINTAAEKKKGKTTRKGKGNLKKERYKTTHKKKRRRNFQHGGGNGKTKSREKQIEQGIN